MTLDPESLFSSLNVFFKTLLHKKKANTTINVT